MTGAPPRLVAVLTRGRSLLLRSLVVRSTRAPAARTTRTRHVPSSPHP
ncbi:hypothetical protein AB0O42_10300 [Streptomyces sp. NPDC089922]